MNITISDEAVGMIESVLEITREMDLDDLLVLSHAVIEQTKIKSNLKGPQEVTFMVLGNRFKRRIKEGYVPEEMKERIERAVMGEGS